MFCNWVLSGAMSVFYWYCLMKAAIKSFKEWIREASKLVYHVTVAPAKLS